MNRPSWRDKDSVPNRGDDMHLNLPGFKYDGSGRMFVTAVGALAALLLALGGVVAVWWHHDRSTTIDTLYASQQSVEHAAIRKATEEQTEAIREQTIAIKTNTCVTALEMAERRRWLLEGQYCGGNERHGGQR